MTDGVVSTGVIGGGDASREGLPAVEAAVAALRRQLAEQVSPSAFSCWWAPGGSGFYWNPNEFVLAISADPSHAQFEQVTDLISKLPEDFEHNGRTYPLWAVPWPAIGD